MSNRPQLLTHGLSGLSQATSADDAQSPAEQRDSAKQNFLKSMRALPTQHIWHVYYDGQSKDAKSHDGEYTARLARLGEPIASVQAFWRYNNNTPVDEIKMRESIYLFKQGFLPIWEDRRNIHGGSWTFRVPKSAGPQLWTLVQMLAIGEKLESVLDQNDQLCGVGLSVRFNAHLITIWHRESSKQKSVDAILACVMENLPDEHRPKPDNYFYKRHRDHAGFKAPPELQAVLDSQQRPEKPTVTEASQPVVELGAPSAQ
ncbi:Translation Initiation factor eIF- 4e-like domain protein [Metarhizium album ARSEF 1941]|uniref:Translation Initiation factor eIF-4e-like domain protein n=1 Tax=Metarhizium album (strain ARSEF 1941) TaxID=1081103 RepID=A0A0B2WNK8_METAS|nr:Translation Initiation factor eIF- 4e-like domain protein [Metarhizium album ARSEF 1941]KHN94585.1 Translation Initiation factor eIF- 4e-like domain protein [Metarhizium album ARSEF 1941]